MSRSYEQAIAAAFIDRISIAYDSVLCREGRVTGCRYGWQCDHQRIKWSTRSRMETDITSNSIDANAPGLSAQPAEILSMLIIDYDESV